MNYRIDLWGEKMSNPSEFLSFYTKYYNQLKGYTIVSYSMIEDEGALAPFPSFQLTHPTKEDIQIDVSMDEEGNGGGFFYFLVIKGVA